MRIKVADAAYDVATHNARNDSVKKTLTCRWWKRRLAVLA
jgi:hypothetical protein